MSSLKSLSYTDFVGFINQHNVLPGAHDTISRWRVYGQVESKSHVLQIACTTGFQLRELAITTGCSGVGVDLSEYAIYAANYNRDQASNKLNIKYEVADATQFASKEKFSHIALGAGLGFFKDPNAILRNLPNYFAEEGVVLVSPFWTVTPIPTELAKQAFSVFGINPTNVSKAEVFSSLTAFELLYQEDMHLEPENEIELSKYCDDTIKCLQAFRPELTDEDLEYARARLLAIRQMSNILRPYQRYTVAALRYRKNHFPRRLVELF